MKRHLYFLFLFSIIISSCNIFGERVEGNGNIKTETRSVEGFSGVDIGGSMHLHVAQSETYAMRIETDENLLPYIETRMNGDILEIFNRDNSNLDPTKEIAIYVSAPVFKVLRASGASRITNVNKLSCKDRVDIGGSGASHVTLELNAPSVTVDLSGASDARLKGETKDFEVNGSGASNVWCYELMTENVNADLSGASTAQVFASVNIKAGLSGASSLRYKGSATVDSNTSGASSVKKTE
jgi:hypothetical protein